MVIFLYFLFCLLLVFKRNRYLCGIATLLLEEIERYAIAEGIKRITSEVSITARPFFEKHGYTVEVEQKRRTNQLCLTNFWMAKGLVNIKPYSGRIPACGVFCGGCPTYI